MMSTTLNFNPFRKKKTTPSPQLPEDLWRSGRARWGLLRFRRGSDKKWHFSGQQEGETVRLVVRKHWLFLLKPALPLVGSIVLFFVLLAANSSLPLLHPLWVGMEVVTGLLIFGTAIWFLYKDFLVWWLETYIITDKRIINSRGLLQPTRQETPLEKINQTGVDLDNLVGFIFKFGTVHLYLTGGDLKLEGIPHPKEVKDAIQGVTESFKAKKPAKEKAPVPTDSELASVLGTLAAEKKAPSLPDADVHYPPLPPGKVLGPRRTFGGILRIPCDIRYTSGEYTVMYLQRSRYVLYRNLALPVLLFLIMLPVAFFGSALWLIVGLVELVLLIVMFLVYTNYADDVFILTNKRIIDIERRLIFFYEARTETEYKNLRDTKVKVANILERLLDIGDLYIETPGSTPDIVFSKVDHPFVIQDKLEEIKNLKDKVEAVKKENSAKQDLNEWFSRVVSTLEKKVQSEGAPDLHNQDFWSAADVATAHGLRVVVLGEMPVNSGQAPGIVIQQSPPPGTLMNPGAEIQVLLSRRP